MSRMTLPRRSRPALATVAAAAVAIGLPPPATGATAGLPQGELKQAVDADGWTFELWGPGRPILQVNGMPTEIVVRRAGDPAIVDRLRPDRALPCTTGGVEGCVPIDLMGRTSTAVKATRLVVTNHDGGDPELSTAFHTGGGSCCYASVGYWRDPAGGWRSDLLRGGGRTEPIGDRAGRIRIGAARWETLDWSRGNARPLLRWHRVVDGGWEDATTRTDHRRELRAATAAVKRLDRRSGPASRQRARSARAVRIAHQRALGQTRQVREGRRAYRRLYGARSLRRLDAGLRDVARAR
ncbi:MAG: hypothetical protein M0P31_05975 [Solirubrobacteraceae bacterium]|nr:hypothetical protein [Solirubrobacteraceae bacterium]